MIRSVLGLVAGLLAVAAAAIPARAQVPSVESVSPANGAVNVPRNSGLVFTFSTEMEDTIILPTIPGIFVGNLEVTPGTIPSFECEWSDDFRMLSCAPSDDLPPDTTVNWKLNPAGALFSLNSSGGLPLATTAGSFKTVASSGGGGGGGGNDGVPVLVSSSPANGALSVPVTASVQFVFDRAMKKDPLIGGNPPASPGAVGWLGLGLDPAQFTYAWSADGKTLTCDYAGDFPSQAQVAWVLNPANSAVKLQSESGVAMPESAHSGGFLVATSSGGGGGGSDCSPDGVPASWGFYAVSKLFQYEQTGAGDPVPSAEEPFVFGAFVRDSQTGPKATQASITTPGAPVRDLFAAPFGGVHFLNASKPTAEQLNEAYPGGDYTLRFTLSGQSERVFTMAMPPNTPPVPRIQNLAEAQAVNAGQPFNLRWNSFAGATAKDAIVLEITERGQLVFQAPDLCVPRELAPTATSIQLPANTLSAGKTYEAKLSFGNFFYQSTNAVPEMSGLGSVTVTTGFAIKTGNGGGGPGPATPARFTAYRWLPDGRAELTLTGSPSRAYTVERASRISPGDWSVAGTATTDAAGSAVFTDPQPVVFPRFYRAVAN